MHAHAQDNWCLTVLKCSNVLWLQRVPNDPLVVCCSVSCCILNVFRSLYPKLTTILIVYQQGMAAEAPVTTKVDADKDLKRSASVEKDKEIKEQKVDFKENLLEEARVEFARLLKEAHVAHAGDVMQIQTYVTNGLSKHFKLLAEAYIGDKKEQEKCWEEYMDACDARLHICAMRVEWWFGSIILPGGLRGLREYKEEMSESWDPKISELDLLRFCIADAVAGLQIDDACNDS